jgi:hypothetical protein
MPCITVSFDPLRGPILTLGVRPAAALASPEPRYRTMAALVDTGASHTCVHAAVAAEIGLAALGKTPMISASGNHAANIYLADLSLPLSGSAGTDPRGHEFRDVRLTEYTAPTSAFQVLLGRDVICRGFLAIDGYAKTFTFCL